uniref:MI domain-containing protein n=1 Tax=Parascaris univalens TaxID=6257 RepID=A0A915BYU6_PARUN
MTRKRKQTENMQQAEISVPIFSHHADATYNRQYLSSSAGYGSLKKAKASSNYDGNEFNGYDSSKRRKKASRNDRLENNDFKSEFERKYGYEKRQMHRTNDRKDEKREGEHEIEETNESMKTFPNELVSYLQKCTSSIEEDPDEMGETIREKCLEECSGMEMELCFYESSSRLIEKIFKGSRKGACRWIETFLKLKKTRQFEALCTGCACRCLETLIFALSTSLDVQMIEQLTDLIVDGWNDLVVDTNASRFIRSLIRVILELPKLVYNSSKSIGGQLDLFPKEWSNKEEQKRKKAKESLRNLQMRRNFEKIINLALDYNSMHDFMDMEAVSLLMQEIIEYDYFLKTAKINEFLTRSLEYPMSVLKQWKGRQSSRVWQVIVKRVNEDGRQSLYHSILNGKLLELALDNCANFVAQDFIASADSEELAADIFDELLDSLIDI